MVIVTVTIFALPVYMSRVICLVCLPLTDSVVLMTVGIQTCMWGTCGGRRRVKEKEREEGGGGVR